MAAASPGDAGSRIVHAAKSLKEQAHKTLEVLEGRRETTRRQGDAARAEAEARLVASRRALREQYQFEALHLARQLCEESARLARGPLASPWSDPGTLGRVPGPDEAADEVRCGTLRVSPNAPALPGRENGPVHDPAPAHTMPPLSVPLLLPLLGHGNVVLASESAAHREAALGAVREIVLRALLGTGAGRLRVHVVDLRDTGALAAFAAVRTAPPAVVPPPITDPAGLRDLFDRLWHRVRTDLERRREQGAGIGHQGLAGRPDAEREARHLVVVADYPTGFDADARQALVRLMDHGPASGVSFVVQAANSPETPDAVSRAAELASAHVTVLDIGDTSHVRGLEGFTLDLDTAPGPDVLGPAAEVLSSRIRRTRTPYVDFLAVQPEPAHWWQDSSAEEISTVIGRSEGRPMSIVLDEEPEDGNLFLTAEDSVDAAYLLADIVHGFALRYAPDQLAMWFVDLRPVGAARPLTGEVDGAWLPHARVLAPAAGRDLAAEILAALAREVERRAPITAAGGFASYRYAYADRATPRILCLLAGAELLLGGQDEIARTADAALRTIVADGPGRGVHLVASAQTQAQPELLRRIPRRLALELSTITTSDGAQGTAASAPPGELARLRRELADRAGDHPRPWCLDGARPADLAEYLGRVPDAPDGTDDATGPGADTVLLGVPLAVDPAPVSARLADAPGGHFSVIGTVPRGRRAGTGDAAPAALQAAAASLAWSARQAGRTVRFVLLDLLDPLDPDRELVSELGVTVRRLGHELIVATGESGTAGVAAELADLGAHLEARLRPEGRAAASTGAAIYVVGLGLGRATGLAAPEPGGGRVPREVLRAIWRQGAQVGIHLLGWWSTPEQRTEQLGIAAALQHGAEPTPDLVMTFRSSLRALVGDLGVGAPATTVVPFGSVRAGDLDDVDEGA